MYIYIMSDNMITTEKIAERQKKIAEGKKKIYDGEKKIDE